MATRSPITDLAEYESRLDAACSPIPMEVFKVFKATFYSGVMLVGIWLVLQTDLEPTTTQVIVTGLFVFVMILAVEIREIDIASGLASITVSFAPDDDDDDTDR